MKVIKTKEQNKQKKIKVIVKACTLPDYNYEYIFQGKRVYTEYRLERYLKVLSRIHTLI